MRHLKKNRLLIIPIVLISSFTACGGDGSNKSPGFLTPPGDFVGPGQVTLSQSLGRARFKSGVSVELSEDFGSGLTQRSSDLADFAVTSRGPSVDCDRSSDIVDVTDFCQNTGTVDATGIILARPAYTPKIFKINVGINAKGRLKVSVAHAIKITDSNGDPVDGLDNPLSVARVRHDYGPDGKMLSHDPEGIDPQAIAALDDGTFWVGDNFGPSLLHISTDGVILNRVVPSNEVNDLGAANFPVSGGLPSILSKRVLGRGIQAVAVSADGQTLYFAMASPLANPDPSARSDSRNVRIFVANLDNGKFAGLSHEYVVRLDKASSFYSAKTERGDQGADQSDVKISDMSILSDDSIARYLNLDRANGNLVLVERTRSAAKLVRISLSSATDILSGDYDSGSTKPTLAQIDDFDTAGITPVATKQFFSSLDKRTNSVLQPVPRLPEDIEGFTLIQETNQLDLVFSNFNDYGIKGAKSQITVYEKH